MEESKKETLAQLYALRAGMSYVSELKDDYDKYNGKYRQIVKNIAEKAPVTSAAELAEFSDHDKYIEKAAQFAGQIENRIEAETNSEKEKLEKELADVKNKEGAKEYEICKTSGSKIKIRKFRIIGAIVLALILIGAVAVMIYGMVIGSGEDYDEDWPMYVNPSGVIIAAVLVVGFIGRYALDSMEGKLSDKYKFYNAELQEIQKAKREIEIKIHLANEKYEDAQIGKEQVIKWGKDLERLVEQYRTKKYFEKVVEVDKSITDNYSGLLDKRDWQYLDLVIFYYETGRADTIKEALQLVDNERRNAEVISTIRHASDTICGTINSSIRALGSAMTACFDRLSSQINAGFASLSGSIGAVNAQLGQISAQNAALITGQQMQNALMAKASTSSTQLAEDVSYMTTLADQAEVRRRNGQ